MIGYNFTLVPIC